MSKLAVDNLGHIIYTVNDYSLDNPEVLRLSKCPSCGFLPRYSSDEPIRRIDDEIICVVHDHPAVDALHSFGFKPSESPCLPERQALINLGNERQELIDLGNDWSWNLGSYGLLLELLSRRSWPIWLQHRIVSEDWTSSGGWEKGKDPGDVLQANVLGRLATINNLALEVQVKLAQKKMWQRQDQIRVLTQLANRSRLSADAIATIYKLATAGDSPVTIHSVQLASAIKKHISHSTATSALEQLTKNRNVQLAKLARNRLDQIFRPPLLSGAATASPIEL